ncbi:helix-turn-helix transcriptional regulator [Paenibacillus vini]|uniref:response regulator transcription factor n=1 Tax=Paenibacillus vini TaxID=1476024 RepID=UPI0025B6910D|nr:helix-turn-helix transcriptional regulator [Paenibacillus vini]MDN4067676.1 helix-turn-helix transcriptional regulator [Paenibacillus vini]
MSLNNLLSNPIIDQYYLKFKERYFLSKREIEVLKILTLQGQNNRELGTTLNISEKTMKNHIARILMKTKTRSSRELQALIFREMIVPLFSSILETTQNNPSHDKEESTVPELKALNVS